MPPASVNNSIGQPFIELDTVDSTNNYAMAQTHAGLATHGQAYFAHHQFAGKGQRGKLWAANPNENITMSVVLDTNYPNNSYPFILSIAISLACLDFFNELIREKTTIKWPNDLYWRDRKTGGILIENIYRGSSWQYAIAGMGININQTEFNGSIRNAVSLKQITGKTWNTVLLAKQLCKKLDERYRQLFTRTTHEWMDEYNQHLFKKDESVKLKKGNVQFETTIEGVDLNGRLLTSDAIKRSFEFGEVQWVV